MTSYNQFLSFRRLRLLAGKELRENWRRILLASGALFGFMVLIAILISHNTYYEGISPQYFGSYSIALMSIWFSAILAFSGTYVGSIAFRSMSRPTTALPTLMTPASQFEKFLVRWLAVAPAFLLGFFILAFTADWIRVIYSEMTFGFDVRPINWLKPFYSTSGFTSLCWLLIVFLFVQSFFLLGSIVWPRHSMLKTFVFCFALVTLYFWVSVATSTYMMDNKFKILLINMLNAPCGDNILGFIISRMKLLLIIAFNYWLTYRRFREAEIINRW